MGISTKKFLLSIDPSFITMGVCIYDPSKKGMRLFTGDFQRAVAWMGKNVKLSECIAVVENPNLDSAIFMSRSGIKKAIRDCVATEVSKTMNRKHPNPVTLADVESELARLLKMAQHVGMNKASATLIIKMLHDKRVPIIEIAPSQRQRADKKDKAGVLKCTDLRLLTMPTKSNAEQFHALTGCLMPSTEHDRDAATMVWGRTIKWAEMQLQIMAAKTGNQPASYPGSTNHNQFLLKRKKVKS